jgi:hypothetical protein
MVDRKLNASLYLSNWCDRNLRLIKTRLLSTTRYGDQQHSEMDAHHHLRNYGWRCMDDECGQ